MGTWSYIGDRIRAAREQQGWSISDLAKRLDTSHTTISQWEKGKRPINFDDVERLARLLEKPVQWFLPGWYIDPRGLSPELAQLVHKINALPHGVVRDRLIQGFMEQVGVVEEALATGQEGVET